MIEFKQYTYTQYSCDPVEGGVMPELVLILTTNGIYSSEEKELA